jgi:hypothetical protein
MTAEDESEILRIIEIQELIEFRKAAGANERAAWLMAARRIFNPGERQPCHVCGRFRSIAQAHHVVPLSAQYDRGFKYPDNEIVWLCPNHHAMAHLYIPDDDRSMTPSAMRSRMRTTAPLSEDLTSAEFDKLMELMGKSARSAE